MVTSDCGCGEYFKEEDEQEKPLKPWKPIMVQPSYYEPMHAHTITIQRPESAHLPNPEPQTGYPPAIIQQPVQIPFPQIQVPPQNVLPFPQPALQPPMIGTGPPPPQMPLQMPRPPNIGPPIQQQPPPGMGQPVPFAPPVIMQPNQPGFGVQPILMPPMNPPNFNMNAQNLAAVQI
jgi:hypothetical protein